MLGLAFFDFLVNIDLGVLKFLNHDLAVPALDGFWLFITQMHKSKIIMIGVLPLISAYVVYIYRWEAVKLLIALGIAIALADSIAYRGIKSWVDRQRPAQNPATSTWLRRVGEAHGTSFPSNHAANCFAAAVVLSWYFRRGRPVFYALAGLVALSRVVLGVHYPSDVVAGSLLGFFVGWLVTSELAKRMRLAKKRKESSDWRSRLRRLEQD